MGHYTTSLGERISQDTLNRRIKKAKKQKLAEFLDENGYFFCEDCHSNDCVPIDCSHDISIQRCKNMGMVEVAYSVDNITLRGRECHRKHDGLDLKFER